MGTKFELLQVGDDPTLKDPTPAAPLTRKRAIITLAVIGAAIVICAVVSLTLLFKPKGSANASTIDSGKLTATITAQYTSTITPTATQTITETPTLTTTPGVTTTPLPTYPVYSEPQVVYVTKIVQVQYPVEVTRLVWVEVTREVMITNTPGPTQTPWIVTPTETPTPTPEQTLTVTPTQLLPTFPSTFTPTKEP